MMTDNIHWTDLWILKEESWLLLINACGVWFPAWGHVSLTLSDCRRVVYMADGLKTVIFTVIQWPHLIFIKKNFVCTCTQRSGCVISDNYPCLLVSEKFSAGREKRRPNYFYLSLWAHCRATNKEMKNKEVISVWQRILKHYLGDGKYTQRKGTLRITSQSSLKSFFQVLICLRYLFSFAPFVILKYKTAIYFW